MTEAEVPTPELPAPNLDRLRALAEEAALLWDGHTWQPDPPTVARADVDVATFSWPELAALYRFLELRSVLWMVDEIVRLRSKIGDGNASDSSR